MAADYVTLGNYKGLTLSNTKESYDEDEIEIQTKQFYFAYITEEDGIKDRPVQNLDMTNIDYEGKKDGVAFDGGTAQGATLLIGSGQFISGFEEGLIGVMPGETVDLNLKFPDNYGSADLAGQEVVFTVTVNFIPEMKDDKVPEIGIDGVSTVDELRAYVKENMEKQAESEYLSAAQDEVWDQIMETTVYGDFPEDMLAQNRVNYAKMLDQMAASYGMEDGKSYVEAYGQDYEEVLDQYAEVYTRQLLTIQAIADAEGLNISDEELDSRISEYANNAGTTVDAMLSNGLSKADYRQSFLYEDVMNFLVENAVAK